MTPTDEEVTSLEFLRDYECPECGPVVDGLLTEDEATIVICGDEHGDLRCPNDWCGRELELTLEAALDNKKFIAEQLQRET